jgi:hypothetical protein
MFEWDKILLKRAKHDLAMITDFNTILDSDKHVYIHVKDGKCNVKSPKFLTWRDKVWTPRKQFVERLLSKIDFSDSPDCTIPLRVSDGYEYTGQLSFCWAKPQNKSSLLFPCWSFDNWEKTIKEFDKHYIPWEDRTDTGYFKGSDSSKPTNNIRAIVHDIFPQYIDLNSKTFEPITEMMKHKISFDLPGYSNWSVRTPYIDLSGCSSLRVLLYNKPHSEEQWIQFYEHDIRGILSSETDIPKIIPELKDEFNKLLGKRAQNRAEKMREKMKSLTTKHMLTYIKFICNYIGEKQDL